MNRKKSEEREQRISKTTVKSMGFSDRMIEELLPNPELVPNPHYKSAAPMKMWRIKDVEVAMGTQEFKDYQAKLEGRKTAAKKAVMTKEEKLLEQAGKMIKNITVKKIALSELEALARESQYKKYLAVEAIYGSSDFNNPYYAYSAQGDDLERWKVNYIRHNLTNYDEDLFKMAGKTGKGKAYIVIYEAIMQKIAECYPELETACRRGLAWKRNVKGLAAEEDLALLQKAE